MLLQMAVFHSFYGWGIFHCIYIPLHLYPFICWWILRLLPWRTLFLCVLCFFKYLYWSIIALQWCVSFCFITKWISYTYTYIPISPPSWVSLPPSIYHPSRLSQSTELIALWYAAASHWLSILHLVVYICPCHPLTLSQLTLPTTRVLKSILYVCIFISVLPLGSSEPFFFLDSIYMC